MVYEFEGKTEKEAIEMAAEELGLEKDDFDVEIIEGQKRGFFRKGLVRIRVHTDKQGLPQPDAEDEKLQGSDRKASFANAEEQKEFEQKIVGFIEGLIDKMGYPGTVSVLFREDAKIGLKIDSEFSSILIGKKGKNLDALQMLANVYAGRQGHEEIRVILDSENYRIRHEEALVRLAYTVADKVRETRSSVLLEPMNPFDRRLIHTTLNDISDVETKSEGNGLYKQVRVYFRGAK